MSVAGTLASTVGEKNPIRYRGYYYDTETNLYYLNSRYYDPETGRFISADVVAEGGNLYTYCQNDPINRSDESGYLSINWNKIAKIALVAVVAVATVAIVASVTVASGGLAAPVLIGAGIGALIGGGISAGTQLAASGTVDLGQVIVDAAIGGVMGAFGGSSLGLAGMTIAGGVVGFASSIAGDWVADRDIDYGKAFGAGALGAVSSFSGGAGAQYGQTGARQAALAVRDGLSKTSINTPKQAYVRSIVGPGNARAITRHTNNLNTIAMDAIHRSVPYNAYMTMYQKLLFG